MNIREDLKAFVDRELSPERAAEVRLAIDADPELGVEVRLIEDIGREIRALAADPNVVGQENAMRAVSMNRRSWRDWFASPPARLVWVAGALILVVAVFNMTMDGARFSQTRATRLQAGEKSEVTGSVPMANSDSTVNGFEGRATLGGKGMGGFEGGRGGVEAPASSAPAESQDRKAKSDSGIAKRAPSFDSESIVTPNSRMVIQSGSLTIKVGGEAVAQAQTKSNPTLPQGASTANQPRTVSEAVDRAMTIAKGAGGYVEGTSLSGSDTTLPSAVLTLRIPAQRFDQVMISLKTLGTVAAQESSGQDVTTQYADVEGRLKVLRAEADSYVTMLRAAKKVGELLEIKDRLSQVRQEIESMENQRRALANQSSLSTITCTFTQKPEVGSPQGPKDWSQDTWAGAVNGLKEVGRALAQATIFVFVYSPIWLPVVLIGWFAVRKTRR